MSDNTRIYYATKGFAVKKSGTNPERLVPGLASLTPEVAGQPRQGQYGLGGVSASGYWEVPRGVQSVGITTTLNIEKVFQGGQLAIYEQVEERPEIEVTVSRVLDGNPPLYLMCSNDQGDLTPSGAYGLAARNDGYSVDLALAIYNDDVSHASGVAGRPAVSRVLASGMFLSSVSYNFPVDGNATEECTFVGNNKYWSDDSTVPGDAPLASFPDEDLIFTDEDPTTPQFALPTDGTTTGITRREDILGDGGVMTGSAAGMGAAAFPADIPTADRDCVQSISISCDLGQEEILCLGSKEAGTRYVTFPVDVTCSFEVLTADGDMVQAHKDSALLNRQITIITKQGLKIDLGAKNKLESIDFTGGDTGGGNVIVTYNYTNSNDFTVSHARFV